MDVREGMTPSESASYFLNRGGPNSGSVTVPGSGSGGVPTGGVVVPTPPGYRPLSNPSSTTMVSTYLVENNPSPNFPQGIGMSVPVSGSSTGDSVKKKRGRPRKYVPEGGNNMSLALSPMSPTPSPGSGTPTGGTKKKGRPPGSGWRQRLAPLGDWMNKTAGLAFTPHVIHVGIGEDIAATIFAFAQQRPRALCILSANGSVSAVTMRQSTPSGGAVTYEGRFEILCLSGSYLVAETGGRNRTGGLSISVCSPDGHVIGGAIGGRLVASSPVQVVACSFQYGVTKPPPPTTTSKPEETSEQDDKSLVPKHDDDQQEATSPPAPPPSQEFIAPSSWTQPEQQQHSRKPQIDQRSQPPATTEVDLSRG